MSEPRTCAIVGGGLAGFTAYATLRSGGLKPDEIDVFGTGEDPAAAWRTRAASIRQRRMRSESDGHCHPGSFPGLAVRAALRDTSVVPLALTACDRYRPTVDEFLAHVADLRESSRWNESIRLVPIARVEAVDGGFALDGQGVYRHVLLATGHPGLAYPDGLEREVRAVHAYQPHSYAEEVEIVGAGMAAATEWLNALAAGSHVLSVRRREPERRPLNLPRTLFTRRGLASYHRTPPEERVAFLRRWSAPSYPPGRSWDAPVARATREGRFRIVADLNGAQQVICATGFKRGYRHDRLLSRLVDDYGLDTAGTWIVLAPDSTVPRLTDGTRTLALAGAPSQWAFPAADTIVGAKYAARRFLRRIETWRSR